MRIGLLYSRIRKDEKLLLEEFRDRGHEVEKIDVRKQSYGLERVENGFKEVGELDVILNRCMSVSRGLYAARFYENYDIPFVNSTEVAETCADKLKTSIALKDNNVPTPDTEVAFTEEAALEAIERIGYPCVLKPVTGSWGRLLAKVDNKSSAEAILEHKSTLGHYEHSIFYIQEFVDKPGRDIRVLTAGDEPFVAITRSADHWITNTSQGAEADEFKLDKKAEKIVRKASKAVGGGILGIDMMEARDSYTVHEVNHKTEFKNIQRKTEADVPAEMADYLEERFAR